MPIGISSDQPLPDFLGVEWGASQEEAKPKMLEKEAVTFNEEKSGSRNLVFNGGLFANKEVQMWVLQFSDAGLHTAKIQVIPPQNILQREYQDLTARLSREYGSPSPQSAGDMTLYTFGSNGEIKGSILCKLVQGQIITTYQHQRLNKQAMSQMSGLDAPVEGMPTPSRQRGGQNSGCFVATATLGNSDHPAIEKLRAYRDEVLLDTKLGKAFVKTYYATSPPLADLIAKSRILRKMSYVCVVRPATWLADWSLNQRETE